MKIELIKFGTPGKLSKNIYSFDETKVPSEAAFKIIDIRNTSFYQSVNEPLSEYIIGKCQLVKDEEGIWIVGYESCVEITDNLLSKSSNRYWSGGSGETISDGENNIVKNAEILFVYLSVEEDIKEIVRDLKLTQIGI